MTKGGQNQVEIQDRETDTLLVQYVLSIPAGQLTAVKALAYETQRSIQSLLREGVEMLLTRHTKPLVKRGSTKKSSMSAST